MHSNFAAHANSNFRRAMHMLSNKHYDINNLQVRSEAAARCIMP